MKIHGAVYVVIGIFVALYSKFIQSRVESGGMTLFFWVGITLIMYGVFRLIITYVFKDKSKEKDIHSSNSMLEKLKEEKQKMMNQSTQSNQSNSSDKQIISCPRCQTKHYSNSNFCHMCGTSLK